MERKLTEIFGLTLQSEFSDRKLYDVIRSLQFIFLKAYDFGPDLIIEEIKRKDKTFIYRIHNEKLGLLGFVGRDTEKSKILYLVRDEGRLKWAHLEGFDTNDNDVLNKIGYVASCKKMADFILFMSGQKGWEFSGYVQI